MKEEKTMKKMSITDMKTTNGGAFGYVCTTCGAWKWNAFTVGWHSITTGHKGFRNVL